MSSKIRKMVKKKALEKGYSPMEFEKMEKIAKKELDKRTQEMYEKVARGAFIDMIAIPCTILAHDYWPKSAHKKIPEFLKKVISLYDSLASGVVSYDEVAEVLMEYSGCSREYIDMWKSGSTE